VGRLGAQPAADLDAVEAGHAHVEQDQLGAHLSREGERFEAVGGLDQLDALVLEGEADQLADRRFVIGDEDGRHGPLVLREPCRRRVNAESAG
jgi:hypothetical protein